MPHTMLAANAAPLLLDVSLKSLLVFAVAGVSCLVLRRASAAARHALWLLVLAALLCLPLFCALLPRWSAPVLPTTPSLPLAAVPIAPSVPQAATQPPAAPQAQATVPLKAASLPTMTGPRLPPAPAVQPPPARLPLTVWVCLLWLLGTLLVLGRTLLGLAAASRLVRRCRPVMGGPLMEASEQAQGSLMLPRAPSLRVGPVAVPMTCGVLCPTVLLPQDTSEWPADRLRAVLLHEAAHVKRFDWPATLLAQCVCALYWFHPLVWLAAAHLRAEAEGACDDLVLSCGVPAPDYAAHLLEIVRGLTSQRAVVSGTVAMAHRQEVSARLRAILDGHRATDGVTRRGLAVAAGVIVGTTAAIASVHPIPRVPTQVSTAIANPQGLRPVGTWIFNSFCRLNNAEPLVPCKMIYTLTQYGTGIRVFDATWRKHHIHQVHQVTWAQNGHTVDVTVSDSFRPWHEIGTIAADGRSIYFTQASWYEGTSKKNVKMDRLYTFERSPVLRSVVLRPSVSNTGSPQASRIPPVSVMPQTAAQTRPDDNARFLAGLTAVQGPGVVVTLNNSKKRLPKNWPPGAEPPSLIHDTDINQVINILRAAGAEAIAVNDQRLVATSAVSGVGPMVFVNNTAQTPPYIIRAIGDAQALQMAINLPGGTADQLRQFDPTMIRVNTSPRLTLPSYRGSIPDRYARPIEATSNLSASRQQSGDQARSFVVWYFPRKGNHRIRILVSDARGTHTAFDRLCTAGASIHVPVAAYGSQVILRLYDNGTLVTTPYG